MSDLWDEVRVRIDAADLDALADLLAGLDDADRTVLTGHLDGHQPAHAEPEPVVLPPLEPEPLPELPTSGSFTIGLVTFGDEKPPTDLQGIREHIARQRTRERERQRGWEKRRLEEEARWAARQLSQRRVAATGFTLIACTQKAPDAVKLLHRPWSAGPGPQVSPEMVPGLLRVRGAAWCTTLARGLLRRTRANTMRGRWAFTEALLRAVGADPPDTPAAAAHYVALYRGTPLAPILAADPWFDHMLAYLFDVDGVANTLARQGEAREWPAALVELAGTGRIERGPLIAGCLRRLRTGGRQGVMKWYLALVRDLAPTTGELTGHVQELIGLLAAPLSTVADFAYTSLQAVHRVARLDPAALAEITAHMLCRPEKKLVRAHLAWLRPVPLDDVADGLAAGLHHPAPDLAEAVLDLVEARVAELSETARDRLAAEAPSLDGTLGDRLAKALGTAAPASTPAPVLAAADLPTLMPPPLDLGGLAGELSVLLRNGDTDPVRHEAVLDGLVRAARGDRDLATRVLEPILPRWPGLWSALITAACGNHADYPAQQVTSKVPRFSMLIEGRATELIPLLFRQPPPGLLATPSTVAGHVDPARVLSLLERADRDGWQPATGDLTQALMRLPREVDPAIHTAAARLTSPAGRRFAAWLAAGVIDPRTWIEEVPATAYSSGMRVAMLDAPGLPSEFSDARAARERSSFGWPRPALALWPMVTPSHRELAAAHLQPYVAAALESPDPGTAFLDGLAAADGPAGPATAVTLAYAMANRRESVRLAAGDALTTLASRPGWDSTGVGVELGILAASDRVVLRRTLQPLTEALKAGAHDAVWQITSAALPDLLAAKARPGLPELLRLAADAARAGHHTVSPAGLAALASRTDRTQLTTAARKLAEALRR
ncbi:DUF6493 family protein [Phytohabitans aurantiacus]|uniref:DUF6493 domain-containing protein n=1 Tax=Phytohabitans aurantiacus TaxID=3016789 RepID=A0ABQ5QPM0_9ACTN|nr:DUF6493 family protein [Phytohabitans aurantiacus]GLH96363.1 hypothetical protein Pa4123_16370 [Phytohabitans aurantiacus]